MNFTNDLDNEITIAQILEQRQMMHDYNIKTKQKNISLLALTTLGLTMSTITENPLYLVGGYAIFGGALVASKVHSIIISYKKDFNIYKSMLEGDTIAIKRERYREKYRQGKIGFNSPYTYYLRETEIVNEPINTLILKGPIPMAIFNEEETTERLLYEYQQYQKKYLLPSLSLTKDELSILVSSVYRTLVTKNLPHRLYTYLADYFKITLATSLIRYDKELTINDLISSLDLFIYYDYSLDEIKGLQNEIKESLKNYLSIKKLSKI